MSSDTSTSGPARGTGIGGEEPSPQAAEAPTDGKPESGQTGVPARRVLRAAGRATLTTVQRPAGGGGGNPGFPYPSLVLCAFDHDGTPILCLSSLADHTRNLAADPRAGLLFDGTAGLDQPLSGPRLSVLGRIARSDDPRHRARFLARHAEAATYLGFGDFALYTMTVERAHLVAGFGRVQWLDAAELLAHAPQPAWETGEAAAIAALNAAIGAMDADGGATGDGWTVTGADPDGLDLCRGGHHRRLDFPHPAADPGGIPGFLPTLSVKGGILRSDGDPSGR